MSNYPIPKPAEVADLFGGLIGKKVEVKATTAALTVNGSLPVAVATYVDDTHKVVALGLCDLAFSCNMGGAIALVPPKIAAANLKDKELPESFVENLREIVNVSAALINNAGSKHLRLKELYIDLKTLPEEATALLTSAKARCDMDVVVENYGPGKISFLLSELLAQ